MRQTMNRTTVGVLSLMFVLGGTSMAFGQNYDKNKNQEQRNKEQDQHQKMQDRDRSMHGDMHGKTGKAAWQGVSNWRAEELMGMDVENNLGEDLGSIEDLAVDPQSGRIVYAVLSFGGILGMGDKLFAVPFRSLTLKPAKDTKLVLNVPKDRLENAEGFNKDNWPNMADDRWAKNIHKHYEQTPYWEETTDMQPRRDKAGDRSNPAVKPEGTDRSGTVERETEVERSGEHMAGREHLQRPTQIVRASKVIGENVVNRQNETVGEIEDLILDPAEARVSLAVVEAGGFLGMGDELFAIPWNKISHRPDEVVINIDKETLSRAPHFAKDRFPDRNDRTYIVTIYRYYRVDPYWTDTSMDTERPGTGG